MQQNAQLQISDIYKQIILFGDKIVRSLPVMQMLQSDLVDSPVNLHSYPHLWPRAGGSDQKTRS